jgi:hypothetical protein
MEILLWALLGLLGAFLTYAYYTKKDNIVSQLSNCLQLLQSKGFDINWIINKESEKVQGWIKKNLQDTQVIQCLTNSMNDIMKIVPQKLVMETLKTCSMGKVNTDVELLSLSDDERKQLQNKIQRPEMIKEWLKNTSDKDPNYSTIQQCYVLSTKLNKEMDDLKAKVLNKLSSQKISPVQPVSQQMGGNTDVYYSKYLKYKNKYLQLKKLI